LGLSRLLLYGVTCRSELRVGHTRPQQFQHFCHRQSAFRDFLDCLSRCSSVAILLRHRTIDVSIPHEPIHGVQGATGGRGIVTSERHQIPPQGQTALTGCMRQDPGPGEEGVKPPPGIPRFFDSPDSWTPSRKPPNCRGKLPRARHGKYDCAACPLPRHGNPWSGLGRAAEQAQAGALPRAVVLTPQWRRSQQAAKQRRVWRRQPPLWPAQAFSLGVTPSGRGRSRVRAHHFHANHAEISVGSALLTPTPLPLPTSRDSRLGLERETGRRRRMGC